MRKPIRENYLVTWILCLPVISLISVHALSAQDTLSNGKALNLPMKKYGISVGNSREFNGIRINLTDRDVKVINGINVTLWLPGRNTNSVYNGISTGVIANGGTMRPINAGLVGLGAAHSLSGLSVGGLLIGAGDHINGLSFSGLYTEGQKAINGIACSGLFIGSDGTINGLACSGLFVVSGGDINGFVACPAIIFNENNFRGSALTTGYFHAANLEGFAVAAYVNTNTTNGVSLALFNRTKELHGIQFGLLNYAGNNPKGSRILPLMNLHVKKNEKNDQ